jgi:myo-inositol-1(or 4)-monophosphatase
MLKTRSPLVNVMLLAADKTLKGLLRDYGELEHLQVSKKGPADFVSAADVRIENILKENLAKSRPNFGFWGEESPELLGQEGSRWIVDPIDGTTNFLHGIPHFCISIAAEHQGDIIAGVVIDPVKNEVFWAEKGMGAYCNDRRIRVSGRDALTDCLIATGIPFAGHGYHDDFLARLGRIMPKVAGIRRMGAAALDMAYVAAGRVDGYFEHPIKPWDIAAGIILVKEADGIVTDYTGGQDMLNHGHVLASNRSIAGILAKTVGGIA